jgi:endonuclease YncB( thermonuclease family)
VYKSLILENIFRNHGKISLPACYIFILVMFLVSCSSVPSQPSYSDSGTSIAPSRVSACTYEAVRVVDGDTLELSSLGTVRLIGVNAPELSHPSLKIQEEPYGKAAKDFLEKLVEDKRLCVSYDVQEKDSYGRALVYLWLDDPQKADPSSDMVNALMVKNGFALVDTMPPNVKYAELFVQLQKDAQESERGLWAHSKVPIRIMKLDLSAEEVTIKNEGDYAVNLKDFTLVSTKGVESFKLPNYTLKPNSSLVLKTGPKDCTVKNCIKLSSSYVWNNDGDGAILYDSNDLLVDELTIKPK